MAACVTQDVLHQTNTLDVMQMFYHSLTQDVQDTNIARYTSHFLIIIDFFTTCTLFQIFVKGQVKVGHFSIFLVKVVSDGKLGIPVCLLPTSCKKKSNVIVSHVGICG